MITTPAEVEDLIACMPDAVDVVLGSGKTKGLHRTPDSELLPGLHVPTVDADLTVLVAFGILAGVVQGAAITVDGVAYFVRDHRRESDGAELRIFLREA